MIYSKANVTDYECIKSIRQNTHKMHYENEPNYFKKEDNHFTFEYFKEKIEKKQIYNIKIDKELIGYIIINEVIFDNHTMFKDQRILLIEEVTVDDKHKKKAMGRK